jgi:hypothetical protein
VRVGELRSAAPDEAGAGFVGLALLGLASFRPAAPLAAGAAGGPEIRAAAPVSI